MFDQIKRHFFINGSSSASNEQAVTWHEYEVLNWTVIGNVNNNQNETARSIGTLDYSSIK